MNSLALRFESLAIVFRAYAHRIFGGKETTAHKNPTFVVTNLTPNLGDMICTTPVFAAIKKQFPESRLIVVGRKKPGEMVFGNTDIDGYIVFSTFKEMLARLQTEAPEYGVCINQNPEEAGLLLLSGVKKVSAFFYPQVSGLAFQLLSPLIATVAYTPGKYVPSQYLELLRPLGIASGDTGKRLEVNPETLLEVKNKLREAGIQLEKPIVAFAPAAGQLFREWRPERFGRVAAYVSKKYGAEIALLGGPMDTEIAKKFVAASEGVHIFNAVGQSIEEMKALVSLSSIVVGNDSGIPYIAEAFKKPSVIVVGVSDANEHPFGNPYARVLVPEHQQFVVRSIVSDLGKVNVESAMQHLDSISVEQVEKEVDEVFKRF